MEEIISSTREQLQAQFNETADRIRSSEEDLMRQKEIYLKVSGALEILEVIAQRYSEIDDKPSEIALGIED